MKTIHVGTPCTFRHVQSYDPFAVYEKIYQDGTERRTYIIARKPPTTAYSMPPASVLAEFSTKAEAVKALQRWKLHPLPPDPVRRPKNPGAIRRSKPGWSRRQAKSPFQGELDLGPFQTQLPAYPSHE